VTLSALSKKLRLQPGQRIALIDAPAGYFDQLGELPSGAEVLEKGDELDFIQIFVRRRSELERLAPRALARLRHGGLLWISYPKKSAQVESDLSREIVWEAMRPTGWRPVTQVAIDATWSALRFRPKELVGT
jgi:hypothetical protein